MDELSYALGMDPLALRLKNYAERDPRATCRSRRRNCAPATRRAPSASAGERGSPRRARRARAASSSAGAWRRAPGTRCRCPPAPARCCMPTAGSSSAAATDIGTGTYTVMTQIAAATWACRWSRSRSSSATRHCRWRRSKAARRTSPPSARPSRARARSCSASCSVARKMPDSPFAKSRFDEVEFIGGAMRLVDQPATRCRSPSSMAASGEVALEVKYLMLPNILKQRKYTARHPFGGVLRGQGRRGVRHRCA